MNDVIKYIWYDIPESDIVTISYKLLPVIALNGEEPEIEGTFSYLEGEETVEIPISSGLAPIAQESTKDTAGASVTDEPVIEPEVAEVVKAEKVTEAPAATPVAKATPAKPKTKEEPIATASDDDTRSPVDANIIDVPQPETGVFYRVQIAAGKNNLKSSVFEKLYSFEEGFKLENHKGWFKYTTGYHQVYKSARDDRQRITGKYKKFQGPFVTAYNDGERISVQEALMVTAQKWYP
jgi:hypothetical protein